MGFVVIYRNVGVHRWQKPMGDNGRETNRYQVNRVFGCFIILLKKKTEKWKMVQAKDSNIEYVLLEFIKPSWTETSL